MSDAEEVTIIEDPVLILDRMTEIVDNDMLMKGKYITPYVVNRELADMGSVCKGHKACAIGSLFLAAGIVPEYYYGEWVIRGTSNEVREWTTADNPGLGIALDCLNEVSAAYIDTHKIDTRECYDGDPVEALFESYWFDPSDPTKVKVFRDLIQDAKKLAKGGRRNAESTY